MNRIEKLIAELCPDGVEWKKLGDVVNTITAPSKLKRNAYEEKGKLPIIDQGEKFIAGYTNKNIEPVKADKYVVFGDHSEYIKYIDFAFIQGADGLKILKPKVDNAKYIYYAFINFYKKEQKYKRHWLKAKETIIPLPPLPIQEEIVKILDTFTALEAELEAELEARKKQYEYYRNTLLTPVEKDGRWYLNGKEVEWKKLGEVAIKISSGGTPKTGVREYYENGNIPWLRTQEVNFCEIYDTEIKITELGLKNSSAKIIPPNCVIMAMYGATVGKVAINKIPLSTNQACANIQVNDKIANTRYIFYYLSKQYKYIKSLGTGSQTNINSKIVQDLNIPIPPLSEQERIVAILDKFDALVNDISQGLPAEIEARRKQYEYYRNRLLTFEPKQ